MIVVLIQLVARKWLQVFSKMSHIPLITADIQYLIYCITSGLFSEPGWQLWQTWISWNTLQPLVIKQVSCFSFYTARFCLALMKYWCFMRIYMQESESFCYREASLGRPRLYKSVATVGKKSDSMISSTEHTHNHSSFICTGLCIYDFGWHPWLSWLWCCSCEEHTLLPTDGNQPLTALAWFAFPRLQSEADYSGIRYRGIFWH